MRVRINEQFIKSLERPAKGAPDVIYRDDLLPGFAIRVSAGAATFIVQRKMGGSVSVKRAIGRCSNLTVEQARRRARQWLSDMEQGLDPRLVIREQQRNSEKQREEIGRTFGKVFEDYAEFKREGSAPNTIVDRDRVKRKLEKTILWGAPLSELTFEKVDVALSPLFAKHLATGWRVYRYSCAAYTLEAQKNGISSNPFSLWRKLKKPKPVPRRETILPTSENSGQLWLKELVRLRGDERFPIRVTADCLLCLLLWGGRKTETQLLRPEDIDFENRVVVFRGANTKNKRDHYFPLTPWASDILKERLIKDSGRESPWVFPSVFVDKHIVEIRPILGLLKKASGLKIRAHDLRRTFATELTGDSDANLFLVKTAMNHAATSQDVTVGYISVKARVEALRPAYEIRERRIMELAGVAPLPAQMMPDDFLRIIKLAAKNPEMRKAMQKALR